MQDIADDPAGSLGLGSAKYQRSRESKANPATGDI
jgi:hypothetical protein